MSMSMSLVVAKPSISCISLHARSTFHPLQGFHYSLKSCSTQVQRSRAAVTVRSSIQPTPSPTPSPSPSPSPPPTPPPDAANSGSWAGFPGKGWIAGIVISLLLPFLKDKWGPLFFLKKNIAQKLQAVEDVAETLEKVADRVDHITEDFGKSLPDGSFKNAVGMIETVAERVELAAHYTDQAIDKIQELEGEMESYAESNQNKTSESNELNDESNQSNTNESNEEKIDNKPS
ncbi:Matrix metalloproteinase-9 [Bienertia sinuspersici]